MKSILTLILILGLLFPVIPQAAVSKLVCTGTTTDDAGESVSLTLFIEPEEKTMVWYGPGSDAATKIVSWLKTPERYLIQFTAGITDIFFNLTRDGQFYIMHGDDFGSSQGTCEITEYSRF